MNCSYGQMIDAPTRIAISSLSVSEWVRLRCAYASMRTMQMMRIDHPKVERPNVKQPLH